jgi:hypothetical protein
MIVYAILVFAPILGAVATIASLLTLIIAVIRKKSKKGSLIALGISIPITIIGYMIYGSFLGR